MHRLVPQFILEKFKQGELNGHFQAASLFVDISGFTPVTEELMTYQHEGAEALADLMNAIFEPLIAFVYEQGGFITGFAGDAFTAVFPLPENQLHNRYQQALAAAWRIRHEILTQTPFSTKKYGPFPFNIKLGMGSGQVAWGILTDEEENEYVYYFRGKAIAACAQAEHQANRGDFILTDDITMHLRDWFEGEVIHTENNETFWRVNKIIKPLPLPQTIPSNNYLLAQATNFFSDNLLKQTIRGEFRHVYSLFIKLPSNITEGELAVFITHLFAQKRIYGGYLNRIDFGDKGCNLLLFWGTPVTYQNDHSRILSFLLALKEVSSISFRAGVTYGLAYAGYTGSSIREEYTCYSNKVNLAARQMIVAPWSEIWLDKETVQRAKTYFETEFVDEIGFKGFANPLPVYRLLHHLYTMAQSHYAHPMVGRDVDLNKVLTAISPIENGRFGGIVTIQGSAGIGKTRLLHELRHHHNQSIYFHGVVDELHQQSLSPFRYGLRHYFDQTDTQMVEQNKALFQQKIDSLIQQTKNKDLQEELKQAVSFLGALVDLFWEESLYAQLEPKLRYNRTLIALKAFIKAASLQYPFIVEIENAHALDEDSQNFILRLTRQVTHYPFAIVMTTRSLLSWLEKLDHRIPRDTVYLTTLTESTTILLTNNLVQAKAAPNLIAFLQKQTDGNPFFIEQMIYYLREKGYLIWSDTTPNSCSLNMPDGALVPPDVAALLLERLDQLETAVKDVVQRAAVLGYEFQIHILSQMLVQTEKQSPKQPSSIDIETNILEQLRLILSERFNEAELRNLCFSLQIDYENLQPLGKNSKVVDLLNYLKRHQRLQQFIIIGQQQRPDIVWPQINNAPQQTEPLKIDTAIQKAEEAAILEKKLDEETFHEKLQEIQYLFRHALMRDAAYKMQLKKRLSELHLLAAQAFETAYIHNTERYAHQIAYHYLQTNKTDKARFYYEQAGKFASEQYDNQK